MGIIKLNQLDIYTEMVIFDLFWDNVSEKSAIFLPYKLQKTAKNGYY
jgi:hypothetical protein